MANTKIPVELSSTPGIVDNSNATAITINSSETVMIGKTADNTTDVGVVNGSTGYIYATRDGNLPLVLNRKTSDGAIQQFRKDNTIIGSVAVLQSLLGIGNGDAGLLIAGSVDAVAPYNSSTNATRDAAINLGTATNRFQNIFLSGGAYLGGTGSSNYLDDYEEGTWTPTDASDASLSFSTIDKNRYTKIGRFVMAHARIDYPSTSSTSTATVSLPVTPSTDCIASVTGGVVIEQNYSSSVTLTAAVDGTNGARFRINGVGALQNQNLSGKSVRFTVIYISA